MKCNVGGADRNVRIVAGIILVAIGLFSPLSTLWQTLFLVLGAIALITGLIRFCPLNSLLGLDTCKSENRGR